MKCSVDVMKVDVQGAEAEVLPGGREVLRRTACVFIETPLSLQYEGRAYFGVCLLGRLETLGPSFGQSAGSIERVLDISLCSMSEGITGKVTRVIT